MHRRERTRGNVAKTVRDSIRRVRFVPIIITLFMLNIMVDFICKRVIIINRINTLSWCMM